MMPTILILFVHALAAPTASNGQGAEKLMEYLPFNSWAMFGPSLAQNDRVIFIANDGIHNRKPWASDGTAAGTMMLTDPQDLRDFENVTSMVADNAGQVYFLRGDSRTSGSAQVTLCELWVSGGTPATTRPAGTYGTLQYESKLPRLISMGSYVAFAVRQDGRNCLIRTDGTTAGTINVAPALGGGIILLGRSADLLYFKVLAAGRTELWRSDGTPGGTTKLAQYTAQNQATAPASIMPVGANGSRFYFTVHADFSQALWRSDGTSGGTVMVRDFKLAPFYANELYPDWAEARNIGQSTVFGLYRSSFKSEIWRTDGTTSGTQKIEIPEQYTNGKFKFLEYQGKLHVLSYLPYQRATLNRVDDDTTAGRQLALLVKPGFNYTMIPNYFSTNGERIVIATPHMIWQSDGTSSGTAMIVNSLMTPGQFAAVPGLKRWIFGSALESGNNRLWQTDGTLEGTQSLGPLGSGLTGIYYDALFIPLNSRLIYCSMHTGGQFSFAMWSTPYPIVNRASSEWMRYHD